ncbi:SUA5-like translation suppressor [Mycoplasmopsis bovirhinis]|uniref:L-threonylcarbamoyladenylate synthase n=1 Tax=Mycoplasmopsis bovirhinis TaxID=29553 RepID=A0A224AXV3_9BACT|nr:Sua5/YciO/YrdC/YwlC family protein [Mycoplasmopsis bovirhinis]ATO31107.1 SUA5-like translation suppressor [Mycoplasmopsis bovirhinis]BBA22152.1 hypothetical protein MBVR141_0171 [Mycoplasmopsis bovirhinis]VEU63493.1 Putative translation factor (SUA5) [Mycoplasmopsis bovirhinis]
MKHESKLFISTTDTIVGIGGIVSKETLNEIYVIKKRDLNKKIIILVSNYGQLRQFKQWTKEAELISKQYWPGPTTIIINNQGFRIPNHLGLLKLIDKIGPIYMSSANISGQKVINIDQASRVFPEISKIYNFGKPSGKPSTLINLDTNEIIKR